MSLYASIAPAIEDAVIEQIFIHIARMIKFDGRAQAHWMIQQVSEHFNDEDEDSLVTPGYVSGLMWELIDQKLLDIDKYGMVKFAPTAPQ